MTTQDYRSALSSYCGWIGSKSGQAESILIPRLHPLAYETYVEIFAGGSVGLFFRKDKASGQNILNDKDPDVINMHVCVAGQPDAVMAAMERMRPCRTTFEKIKRLRDTPQWWELSDVERGAQMIYLIKNSVNGNMASYSISAKTSSNYNPHFDLLPYSVKLDGVQFECLDWRELIHRLVFKPKTVRLFLYCDPPYLVATKAGHYRFNFDALEHVLFARTLCRINELNQRHSHEVRIMVSYDDDADGLIRSLYRPAFGWRAKPVEVKYDAENHGQVRRELVITNYDPQKCGDNR